MNTVIFKDFKLKSNFQKILFRMGKLLPTILTAAVTVEAEKMFIIE